MILDAITYNTFLRLVGNSRVQPLINFLEKRLGGYFVIDRGQFFERNENLNLHIDIANQLKKAGIISSFYRNNSLADEPPIHIYNAIFGKKNQVAGGISADKNEALIAALAESLERYLWMNQTDFFVKPTKSTTYSISQKGAYIGPEEFTSFSHEQRHENKNLRLSNSAEYLWVLGNELVSNTQIFVPAQTISGTYFSGEPLIRQQVSTGLATWPNVLGARLRGILEVIERDAYTITWLNQLTLKKVSLDSLVGKSKSLDNLLDQCTRYRLKVNAVRMLTDAPTHAIAVIVEDSSEIGPRYSIGLKAASSMPYAVEKAAHEALRARLNYRFYSDEDKKAEKKQEEMKSKDRLCYWGKIENSSKLDFLSAGDYEKYDFDAPWEQDLEEVHLQRILDWCKSKNYRCVAVSPGNSKVNPTKLCVETIIIPEMQPTYLAEKYQHLGGSRLKKIPEQFGYLHRKLPFTDAPHPYV